MRPHDGLHHVAFAAMGGDNAIAVGGLRDAAALAARAIDEVLRIERKYSRYRDDSVVAAINRAAGGAPVPIDAETAALFDYADLCHAQSGGRFDLTSGVYRRVWTFRGGQMQRPPAEALAKVRALVGWARVERTAAQGGQARGATAAQDAPARRSVAHDDSIMYGDGVIGRATLRLPVAGMEIDLGGLGKEYAADRAAALLRDAGARHGLVNLGGDVRVFGGRPDGAPWRIGIRDPRRAGGVIAWVDLDDGAVATSGDEQRFVEVDGRRLAHIVDARDGEPVAEWRSISVVAPLAIAAGSHATLAMLWRDEAAAFLARAGLPWLGVDAAGELHGPLNEERK